jgi:hypothetical protein
MQYVMRYVRSVGDMQEELGAEDGTGQACAAEPIFSVKFGDILHLLLCKKGSCLFCSFCIVSRQW